MTYYANTPPLHQKTNCWLRHREVQWHLADGLPSSLHPNGCLVLSYKIFQVPLGSFLSNLHFKIELIKLHLTLTALFSKKNSSLLVILRDEPLHASPALPNAQNRSSLSPQAIQPQPWNHPLFYVQVFGRTFVFIFGTSFGSTGFCANSQLV